MHEDAEGIQGGYNRLLIITTFVDSMRDGIMLLYHSEIFEKHITGNHPECAARIANVNAMLEKKGWIKQSTKPNWLAASVEQCRRNHTESYIEQLHRWCDQGAGRVESDTVVSIGSWDAATLGAGAACDAVRRVFNGEDTQAFCAIRPPGHHALQDAPMGFCLLNNISIAAQCARTLGCHSVLIVDWDVHHGNGTQASFWEDPSVGFVSIHRFPFYPGTGRKEETGAGAASGTKVNIPVPADTGPKSFLDQLATQTEKLAQKIKPDLILLSAGFDAHVADPVGGLSLEAEHYFEAGKWIAGLAREHCQGRLVSLLEGGYHLQHMPECVDAHLRGMTDKKLN
jgi:acetoin utilization deacetylase AcuC-like enzyme